MREGEQGNGGNAEKRGRRDTPASGRRGGRAGRSCGPRRADGLPRAGGPQRVAWFLRAHGLHQTDVAAHDGMSVFDLSPAASSARHPPQPTRRPKPPGGQTIRNPPYCPKVSRGESVPSLSVSATGSNRAHAASGHNIPEHPPPEYGLTLMPNRSAGTQNGRDLPPCRRLANRDRFSPF